MNRQEASLYFRLRVVPYSPVPPNKAMQTDGRFATAADRQGVRQIRSESMDPGSTWRRMSDEEVEAAAQHLEEYTEVGQQAILAEVQRRGLASSGEEIRPTTTSRPPVLGTEIQRRLALLFAAEEQEEAAHMLLVLQRGFSEIEEGAFGLERVQSAALRVSHGDLGRLRKAIEVGQRDYRDLLTAAGFGTLKAHERWEPTPGKISRWERLRERLFGIQ